MNDRRTHEYIHQQTHWSLEVKTVRNLTGWTNLRKRAKGHQLLLLHIFLSEFVLEGMFCSKKINSKILSQCVQPPFVVFAMQLMVRASRLSLVNEEYF